MILLSLFHFGQNFSVFTFYRQTRCVPITFAFAESFVFSVRIFAVEKHYMDNVDIECRILFICR